MNLRWIAIVAALTVSPLALGCAAVQARSGAVGDDVRVGPPIAYCTFGGPHRLEESLFVDERSEPWWGRALVRVAGVEVDAAVDAADRRRAQARALAAARVVRTDLARCYARAVAEYRVEPDALLVVDLLVGAAGDLRARVSGDRERLGPDGALCVEQALSAAAPAGQAPAASVPVELTLRLFTERSRVTPIEVLAPLPADARVVVEPPLMR
ncbi:MAG: hypothetical protein R3B09_04655 [Nannocystaceae bacterium]